MEGRRAGLVVLLSAATLLVVVPRGLSTGMAGVAYRAALPAPPPVGSCLQGFQNDVVDCREPHTTEVVLAWSADTAAPSGTEGSDPCANAHLELPALGADHHGFWWSVPVNALFPVITGPVGVEQRFGWRACVVMPSEAVRYNGSIMAAEHPSDRPGAFGECAVGRGSDALTVGSNITCLAPHATEIISYGEDFIPDDPTVHDLPVPPPPSDSEARAQCNALAATVLEAVDPTFGGVLAVTVEYEPPSSSSLRHDGTTVTGTFVAAACTVSAPADRQLTDSVVGIGTNPLPLR